MEPIFPCAIIALIVFQGYIMAYIILEDRNTKDFPVRRKHDSKEIKK